MNSRYILIPSLVLMTLGLLILTLPKGFIPDALVRLSWFVVLSAALAVLLVGFLAWRVASRQLRALALTAMRVSQGRSVSTVTCEYSSLQLRSLRRLQTAINAVVRRSRDTQLRLNRLAFFDPLTGLANRECFRRRVEAFLRSAKPGNEGALILVDLDGFKTINAGMGYEVGDDVLGQVGARLRELVGGDGLSPRRPILENHRSDATVARMGGDIFGVFLPHIGTSAALSLSERVRRHLGIPFPFGRGTLQIGVSIGIATVPNDSLEYAGLLKAAEIAMHSAKRRGKNRVCIAGAHDGDTGIGHAAALFAGGQSDAPALRFRPILRAGNMEFAGVEALLCEDPREADALDDRCALLQETGMLNHVHHEAFEAAMEAMTKITGNGIDPVHLSLRVPVALLLDEAFMLRVLDLLPLPYDLNFIVFETPRYPFAKIDASWAIDRLADAGAAFVLENFGSEQGALTSLLEYAPHFVRLDQRLTRAVAQSKGLADLTGSLVRMAHAADVGVVAQGVQTQTDVACLQRMGVDYLQGPFFGAALTADELVDYLRNASDARALERLQKLQESGF